MFDDGLGNACQPTQLMDALDEINRRYGKNTVRHASELLSQRWHMRQQFKSPSYTTRWDGLLTVQA